MIGTDEVAGSLEVHSSYLPHGAAARAVGQRIAELDGEAAGDPAALVERSLASQIGQTLVV